jgi:threonine synthase
MRPKWCGYASVRQAALAVDQGTVYASHAYLPHVLAGYATLAFELYEQMGGAPGTVVMPAGQGNLLLGATRGFVALKSAGLIERAPNGRRPGLSLRPLWALFPQGQPGWFSGGGRDAGRGVQVLFPVRGDAAWK